MRTNPTLSPVHGDGRLVTLPEPLEEMADGRLRYNGYGYPTELLMRPQTDIAIYSPDNHLVLVVEVKGGKQSKSDAAAQLRRNLLVHGLLPISPYFLLAYQTNLFLWRSGSELLAPPQFTAPAKPVLQDYLRSAAGGESLVGEESLQLALVSWLSDLASDVRSPQPSSEADEMIVQSGLYDLIKHGEVKSEIAL